MEMKLISKTSVRPFLLNCKQEDHHSLDVSCLDHLLLLVRAAMLVVEVAHGEPGLLLERTPARVILLLELLPRT